MSFRSKDETFEVNFRSDFKNLYQKLYFLFFYSETKTLRNYNPPLSPITITSCQTCTNQKFMTLFFIIIKIQCWASAYIKITTTDTKYSLYHFIATTYVSDPFFLVQSQTNIDICIHLSFFPDYSGIVMQNRQTKVNVKGFICGEKKGYKSTH